jgi:hypothetical protein
LPERLKRWAAGSLNTLADELLIDAASKEVCASATAANAPIVNKSFVATGPG